MARIIPNEELNSSRRERYANDPEYRAKRAAYGKKWRAKHAEQVKATKAAAYRRDRVTILADERRIKNSRKYHLSKTYGITTEQYEDLLERQGGTCATCSADEPGGRLKNFAVDHDHETGEIRGLLCFACNLVLGLIGDDAGTLRALADYLSTHLLERTN